MKPDDYSGIIDFLDDCNKLNIYKEFKITMKEEPGIKINIFSKDEGTDNFDPKELLEGE